MAALQGVKAALSGVQAVQGGQMAELNASDQNAIGISLSYGSQSSKSEQTVNQTTHQGSTLTAGNNLNITATGSGVKGADGDIVVHGSQLQAGKDASLTANRDVIMQSTQETQTLDGSNKSSGGSLGIGIGAGQGGWGINISASLNKGKGSESGNGLTHTETTVNAGNQLNITSGRDTVLHGAQVSGETVKADVGRDLLLQSQQDCDRYDSKQQDASVGGSFNFGSMTGSASINASRDKMHSNFDSVQEQTGFFAGKGGFDITVGEHTQLDGAVIASTATADKNTLDTGTLGFSNIGNKADFKVEHQSVGISTGGNIGGQFVGNMANGLLVGANNEGHADSTTHAAVSDGSITLRDTDKQQQNVTDLSRDVEHANNALSPIFDKEKEQNRLREAQLIGEIGSQVSDVIRTQGDINGLKAAKEKLGPLKENATEKDRAEYMEKLRNSDVYKDEMKKNGTDSALQQGVQAATAAIQGLAGGDMAKALAGASAPYLAEVIHNMTTDTNGKVNVEANLMAHAVLGAVMAQVNGNSALAGASGAVMGEYIAQQMYPGINREDLTEEQRQTISALGTLASGLAGGLAGGSTADAAAGAQAGKNALENNSLGLGAGDIGFWLGNPPDCDTTCKAGIAKGIAEGNLVVSAGIGAVAGGAMIVAATPEIAALAKAALKGCKAEPAICLNNVGLQVAEAVTPGGVGAAGVIGVGKTAVEATAARAGAANAAKNISSGSGSKIDAGKFGQLELDVLSQTGAKADPAVKAGNLTIAGRALQKHGSREGSAFPIAKGTPTQMNEQGQKILDGIVKAPGATVKDGNRFGGFDVVAPDGRGARFDPQGNFRGFLEP
ncbi:TPA: hemagglutinin repeat-containing protein [Yersinia enterocolitica]|nr:hemagglutinin repeat-containing protein [Yersinia enterocolitica]HDL7338969.1 hemagglutinin repeat-containing protein [Yersinia enterocolitica]HDW8043096.1 hemagglutinin repeat-containing protein [Yersinia enterocolitica]HEM6609076.1 hemagglutinin repeat-containing protein [Yersinia enterocolitica]HEN4722101.1 hemagglutinin repeat-containing protein [Yersinia enterocolitica]